FEIKQNLLSVGWDAAAVEQGFVMAKAAENKTPSIAQDLKKDIKTTPTLTPQEQQLKKEPIPEAPPTATPVTSKGSFFAWKTVVLFIIIVLALLAGGAYAYFN